MTLDAATLKAAMEAQWELAPLLSSHRRAQWAQSNANGEAISAGFMLHESPEEARYFWRMRIAREVDHGGNQDPAGAGQAG